MKKKLFSFGMLLSGMFLFSCNNSTDSGTSATSDSSNMTTNSTSTMSSAGDSSSKMSNMSAGDSSGSGKMATTATATPVADMDKKFMMDAAAGGMMEVQAGQLAATNASSDRVKAFGNMMVQDHTNANNELKSLASSKSVMLPDSLPAKHREHISMLQKKTGKDFDKAYMSMMLMDHKEDISKFQMASNSAKDADLKAFASKTLPTLRTHLDSAKAISMMKK